MILWLKCAQADPGKINCNRFKENVDLEKCKSKTDFSQISAPLEHKMNVLAQGNYMKSHGHCVLIYVSAVTLAIFFLLSLYYIFFPPERKKEKFSPNFN